MAPTRLFAVGYGSIAFFFVLSGFVLARYRCRAAVAVRAFAGVGTLFVHGSPAVASWTAPLFLVLVVLVTQARMDGRGILSWRRLVHAGQVSFCFYLVHQLVVIRTFAVLGHAQGPALPALLVSAGPAVLLHHGVELPANRFLTRSGPRSGRTAGLTSPGGPAAAH